LAHDWLHGQLAQRRMTIAAAIHAGQDIQKTRLSLASDPRLPSSKAQSLEDDLVGG
jgi:hypothetical protein